MSSRKEPAIPTTRRALLKAGGLSLVSLGFASAGPDFLRRAARAAPGPQPLAPRPVLVALFQRGAMDGLMAVPPLGGGELRKLRPRLAMSATRRAADEAVLDLGVGFGLHPAFEPLLPLWRDRRLAVVHAVGSPDPSRGHFDAQDYMETGTPGRKGTSSGWLNRVLGELGHEGTPLRAVSLTTALPRSLYGEEKAIAVARLDDLRLGPARGEGIGGLSSEGFESLYRQTSQQLLREAGAETFEAVELLSRLELSPGVMRGQSRYPRTPLGRSLSQIALLIKAEVGLEVAFAESGGWDTHVRQGTTNGVFANRAAELAAAIAAFWEDLGAARDRVVLLTMTEFGRTVAENGSAGTDHGHGSCLFVLGDQVAGGRVHGSWPGLGREALNEGRDLAVTTDFRSVFTEVARRHLRIPDRAELFPGWKGEPLPLWRA